MRKKVGKQVSGKKYVADNEKYDKKIAKKEVKSMKTPGIAVEIEIAKKEEGYSKKPRVKPQKKVGKLK